MSDIRGYGPGKNKTEKKYLEIGALVYPEESQLEICGTSEQEPSIYEARLTIEARLPKEQVLSVIDALQNWAENYLCGRCLCTNGIHHPFCQIKILPDEVVRAFSEWEDIPEDIFKAVSECNNVTITKSEEESSKEDLPL